MGFAAPFQPLGSGGPAADRHLLNRAGLASNDQPDPPEAAERARCHFHIYRADAVRLTTTRFSGGDWRWRLSDDAGRILVEAGGYRSEAHCREAVGILQARAALATLAGKAP